ncbi:MAG TPA: hypothetical protein VMI55_05960 [Thermoplasmata archaeon]|nr:hypothetical protein [Thermoplasmata archaeon]
MREDKVLRRSSEKSFARLEKSRRKGDATPGRLKLAFRSADGDRPTPTNAPTEPTDADGGK